MWSRDMQKETLLSLPQTMATGNLVDLVKTSAMSPIKDELSLLFGGCPFWKNDIYLTNFCLVKLIVKIIPSHDFWGYRKGQPARIYRPGFINKQIMLYFETKIFFHNWVGLEKKLVTFPLFSSCLYISRNDPWIVKYVWIKRDDVTK